MSSQDTMQRANAEGQKANDLEAEAQRVLDNARQQADGMQQQAKVHRDEQARLTQKSQDEVEHEKRAAQREAQEAQKELKEERITGLFG